MGVPGVDTLSLLELLNPTLFVLASVYLVGPHLPMARPWARVLVFAIAAAAVVRYLDWRIFYTVLPANGAWYKTGWIWLCLGVELLAFADLSILYLTFLRVSDRKPDADRQEQRLRALAPSELPSVDVFIPTFNEPMPVVEKAITGALCLGYPNFKVWVLDDGRRPWLKEYCEMKGAGYLTRPNNDHAKAGNINHALSLTSAEFVAVFDADFVPQQNFLMRTLGLFEHANVGIVQVPHAFYNCDPMQANLALCESLPHDQSFFFESIMPSRDAWNAAFCCGSNSVIRRSALAGIGGGLPLESITEDILLTLALLRHGYVTRYLCERLAFGLAPESVDAFFVQRQRWARGGIQTLYLAAGPLGRGLSFFQRLMFLPTHWLSQSPTLMLALVVPVVFLWTGLLPFVAVTPEAEIYYFLPMIFAVVGGLWLYAPKHFSPLAAYVLGTFQSFQLLPHIVQSVLRPFGHIFKVTPKGAQATRRPYHSGIFWSAAALILLTIAGLVINTIPEFQIVPPTGLLPIAALLAGLNIVVLFLVCMLSLQGPMRAEERFRFDEPIWLFTASGALLAAQAKDLSMSGAGITADNERAMPAVGDLVNLYIIEVGFVGGRVVRREPGFLGVEFDLPQSLERDLLIRKLFTSGVENLAGHTSAWASTIATLRVIWSRRSMPVSRAPAPSGAVDRVSVRLPAQSLMIAPRAEPPRLAELGAQRRKLAA